jgi:hypothetical protein
MRRFFSWLSRSTFEQRLIERLLDQNAALLDRLLLQAGHEPTQEPKSVQITESAPLLNDDVTLAEEAQTEQVKAYALEAAADPEMMEQALYNADRDNGHPGWRYWRDVVRQAEAMMERPS